MTALPLATRKALTLEAVRMIAAAAEAEARRQGYNMTIAVVDDGGHLLHFMRMDGASVATGEIAIAKARAAALFRRATRISEETVKEKIYNIVVPNTMPIGGGVPLMADGVCIGAIAASGSTAANDDAVAQIGANLLA